MSPTTEQDCWRASLHIDADHPALAGHFPSRPLVPGVLLLDEILHALSGGAQRWRVETVKFHHAVAPGETLQLQVQRREHGGYVFEVLADGQRVISGLLLRPCARAPDNP